MMNGSIYGGVWRLLLGALVVAVAGAFAVGKWLF